jgi:hypothetical protein
MIRFAAIKLDDKVYVGALGERHNHVIASMVASGLPTPIKGVQGFTDDSGAFLDRHQAAQHAFACGQLPFDKTCPDIIISEDLW